jgi:hypothetical protein
VCKYVLPPGDNPIAVNEYIMSLMRHFIGLSTKKPPSGKIRVPDKSNNVNYIKPLIILAYID